ncbi:MAG: CHAP domain-containing protein, partial [Bacilli bacterium]
QTKEKTEQGISANEKSPNEYATNHTEQTVGRIKDKAIYEFNKQGQKGLKETKQNISKARDFIRKKRNNGGPYSETNNGCCAKSTENSVSKQIKTLDRGEKTIKQSSRSAGKTKVKTVEKQTIKTTQKSVKTAEKTSKATVKTAQQSAKAAQKTAQATVKASQRAAQAARAAAKAAATTLKVAAKTTVAAVKAIIAGTKALVSVIAAGGWIAVVIILIICLIALIFGSCFGIFFSGEDSGTGQTMQTAVQEINAEYQTKLNETQAVYTYDVLEMSGSRAAWKEVLAVYAVKTTTDSDNPKEVATVDDGKKERLKSIFWDMNEISSRIQSKIETVIDTTDDGQGNIIETNKTVTRTYLYITVSHKTAEEMADNYDFNAEQRKQLSELLSDKNNSMWNDVLYGISGSDGQLVTTALSQVGNTGGQPYWSWYGFSSRVEWCACFVSWCANECGYIDAGIIPKFAACASQGVPWYKERGEWQDNSYIPSSGDIIFFDWEGDGEADHVGIVEKVENGRIYTIEGNSDDRCKENSYPLRYSGIFGFGVPAY